MRLCNHFSLYSFDDAKIGRFDDVKKLLQENMML